MPLQVVRFLPLQLIMLLPIRLSMRQILLKQLLIWRKLSRKLIRRFRFLITWMPLIKQVQVLIWVMLLVLRKFFERLLGFLGFVILILNLCLDSPSLICFNVKLWLEEDPAFACPVVVLLGFIAVVAGCTNVIVSPGPDSSCEAVIESRGRAQLNNSTDGVP